MTLGALPGALGASPSFGFHLFFFSFWLTLLEGHVVASTARGVQCDTRRYVCEGGTPACGELGASPANRVGFGYAIYQ